MGNNSHVQDGLSSDLPVLRIRSRNSLLSLLRNPDVNFGELYANNRIEIEGDPVRLLREPKNAFDEYAISVFDERDIQLGYVRSERAAWLAPQIDRGLEVRAIFQESTSYGCAIRAAFGGEDPQLPSHHDQRPTQEEQDWWPDPEPLDE